MRVETKELFNVTLQSTKTNGKSVHSVSYWSGKERLQGRGQASSLPLYPKLEEGYKSLLTTYKWNRPVSETDTTCKEGEVLKETTIRGKSKSLVDGQTLLRHACDPYLFPRKLLSHYG